MKILYYWTSLVCVSLIISGCHSNLGNNTIANENHKVSFESTETPKADKQYPKYVPRSYSVHF